MVSAYLLGFLRVRLNSATLVQRVRAVSDPSPESPRTRRTPDPAVSIPSDGLREQDGHASDRTGRPQDASPRCVVEPGPGGCAAMGPLFFWPTVHLGVVVAGARFDPGYAYTPPLSRMGGFWVPIEAQKLFRKKRPKIPKTDSETIETIKRISGIIGFTRAHKTTYRRNTFHSFQNARKVLVLWW